MTDLSRAVEQAALAAWRPSSTVLNAVRAGVEVERREFLDVVDVLAGQACCEHRRGPLNLILGIYGREPVEGPTLGTPDGCGHVG